MELEELTAEVTRCKDLLLVVTGAGISVASGIPTFRGKDPGAVWANDVMRMGTRAYFEEDPVGSWSWYLKRFEQVLTAKPNPAHLALAELERWQLSRGGRFLLVTQNIDTLHEQARSQQLIKVHGSADRVRCGQDECEHGAPSGSLPRAQIDIASFQKAPGDATLPRCPTCRAVLRQHVLWFDEHYTSHDDYRFREVATAAANAALVLFAGTSFSVGVTELLLTEAFRRRAPIFSVDPSADSPYPFVRTVPLAAERALPELVLRLTETSS